MQALLERLLVFGLLATLLAVPAVAQSQAANELVGSEWELVSYGVPGSATPVIAGSGVTLAFETETRATGHGGCNGFSATYSVDGTMLSFSQIVSTMMACADDAVTQQEQVYFDALRSAWWYDRSNDRLTIQYGEGQELVFAPLGSGSVPPPPTAPGTGNQIAPPVESFEDLDSPVGLLASYYNAISRQEYERAYGYWETPPHAYAEFADGFADTAAVQVIVQPPTRYSAAAGSRYVDIPTVLIAQHHDGTQSTFAGCFVTRTANLRPPDIPEPDVWHLYSADLAQVPNDGDIPALLADACPA